MGNGEKSIEAYKRYCQQNKLLFSLITYFTSVAYLYHEFNMQADFDAAEKYAKDLGVLLWSNPAKRKMSIAER